MSHMNESCHIWMSHVTYEWVMSHMNESCHIWMSHHMKESCHIWMSHVTYEWVMSHMNEPCHVILSQVSQALVLSNIVICISQMPYEWVMSRKKESCHVRKSHVTYEWVRFHKHWCYQTSYCPMDESIPTWMTWMRHVAWRSHVTHKRVMSHTDESCHMWMNHVTQAQVLQNIALWMSQLTKTTTMDDSITIRISHVTYWEVVSRTNESCHASTDAIMHCPIDEWCDIEISHDTCEWVTSHMNESCHIWMSHVTYK